MKVLIKHQKIMDKINIYIKNSYYNYNISIENWRTYDLEIFFYIFYLMK